MLIAMESVTDLAPGDGALLDTQVLVVHDPAGAAAIQDALPSGVNVVARSEGLQALRTAHAQPFALAIVDVDLGQQPDGAETAFWLRKLFGIPVIAISGREDQELRLRAAAASLDAFMVRPVAPAELHALVTAMLSQHRAIRSAFAAAADVPPGPDPAGILRRPAGFLRLTGREWQVVLDVVDAPTAPAVAQKRGLSPHTVHNQLKSIFRKLGVHSVPELLSLLIRVSRAPH